MVQEFTFPQSGDADDAEHFAAMIGQSNLSDYVERGLEFTYNAAGPSVDVSAGKAYISQTTVNASSTGEEIYNANYVVQVPAQTVSLSSGAVNYVYLEPNFGTDDSGNVAAYTTEQTGNVLQIGTIDTSTDSVSQSNRVPDVSTENLDLSDFGSLNFGNNDEFRQYYDPDTGELTWEDINGNVLAGLDAASLELEVDLDMQGNDILDVNTIGGGGSEVDFTDALNLPAGSIDADEMNLGNGLEDDGTGSLQFDEDGSYSFTNGLDVRGDITDDTQLIWDSAGGHLEQTALENDSVTVAGNNVALGGTATVDHADLSNVGSADHHTRYTDTEAVTAVESADPINLNNPSVTGGVDTNWHNSGTPGGYDKHEVTWNAANNEPTALLLVASNEAGARLAGTLNGWRHHASVSNTMLSHRVALSISDETTPSLGAGTLQTYGYNGAMNRPDLIQCTYNNTDYYAIRYEGTTSSAYPHRMEFSGSYSQNVRLEAVPLANVSNITGISPTQADNMTESNVAVTAPRFNAMLSGTDEGGFFLDPDTNIGMTQIGDDTVLYSEVTKQLKVRSNTYGSFGDVFNLMYGNSSDVRISLQRGEKAVMREGQGNHREIYISSTEPSGWSNGDIWFEPQ